MMSHAWLGLFRRGVSLCWRGDADRRRREGMKALTLEDGKGRNHLVLGGVCDHSALPSNNGTVTGNSSTLAEVADTLHPQGFAFAMFTGWRPPSINLNCLLCVAWGTEQLPNRCLLPIEYSVTCFC